MHNKGADQTARMHRLICTFVCIRHKQVSSWRGSEGAGLCLFVFVHISFCHFSLPLAVIVALPGLFYQLFLMYM